MSSISLSNKFILLIYSLILIACIQDTSREEIFKHLNTFNFDIAPNENIAAILSNATIQKQNGQYFLNFIDMESKKMISINFSKNEKNTLSFEDEGPNSFRYPPSYFYKNEKSKYVVVSNEGSIYVCAQKKELLIEQELEISSSLRHQFETNFKPGLQQTNKLVFWGASPRRKVTLYLFNINDYKIEKYDVPDNDFLQSLMFCEVSEFTNTLFPFVTIDDQTFIVSTWHSDRVFMWQPDQVTFEEQRIQVSVPSIATESFFNSWDVSLKALYSASHGPVFRDAKSNIYVVENYYDAQGPKKPELTILDNSGKEVLQVTHESKNRKFWVDGELVELIIDEEKNILYLNIWKQ